MRWAEGIIDRLGRGKTPCAMIETDSTISLDIFKDVGYCVRKLHCQRAGLSFVNNAAISQPMATIMLGPAKHCRQCEEKRHLK